MPPDTETQVEKSVTLFTASSWQNFQSQIFNTTTPNWCRYNPEKPFTFPLSLNFMFAFVACFTVANLYYPHPILNLIAKDFAITNEQASHVPTLAQAGYAVGLLLLCPLGDVVKRRPLIIVLVFITATLWIGLCLTHNYALFQTLTFLTSITTVTPQLMIPLVGQLAPPHRKATAIAIGVSGLLSGMLLARLFSGIVALYTSWRNIYWISLGLQSFILTLLILFMPDYPPINPSIPIQHLHIILLNVLKSPYHHPVLAQSCMIQFLSSACFGNFWTTLVFLLSGPPYNYSSLVIGLFALIGIGSMAWGPIFGRVYMDNHPAHKSALIGLLICLVGVIIGTYAGPHTVAGPVIQASTIEIGLLTVAIANRTAIYARAPGAVNQVNTAYMFCGFVGQLCGTAVGNAVFAKHGWIASGSVSVAFILVALVVWLARGPNEEGWIGWGAGGGKVEEIEEGRSGIIVGSDMNGLEGREQAEEESILNGQAQDMIGIKGVEDGMIQSK